MLDFSERGLWTFAAILVYTEHCRTTDVPACHATRRDSVMSLEISSSWKSTDICLCSLSTDQDSTHLNVKFNKTSESGTSNVCGPYLKVESGNVSSFHICPHAAVQGATVGQNSNITVFYWTDTEIPPSPVEILFTNTVSFDMTCVVMESSLSAKRIFCPCLKIHRSIIIQDADFNHSVRIMRGLAVSISFLVFCGLLTLLYFLNRRHHFLERLRKGGGVSSRDMAIKGEETVVQTSNGYEELPTDKSKHPTAVTRPGEYCNKAYEELTPEIGQCNRRDQPKSSLEKDRFDRSKELEIQPYSSFSEMRLNFVLPDLVGRGALNASDIHSSDYKSPKNFTFSTRQVRPLGAIDSSSAAYAKVDKTRPVAASTQYAIWPRESSLDCEALYGKVNRKPKSTVGKRAEERISMHQDDLNSHYVLPDSSDV